MAEIHVINRTGGGLREAFAAPVVTFGRGSDNMLIVGGEHTSRLHGELRCEDDRWLLVNLGANGTELNGRRVTGKPRQLNDRDVVGVAGEALFEVRMPEPDKAAAVEPAADDEAQRANVMSKRTKLWMFIGIYLVLFFALFFFLSTLKSNNEAGQRNVPPLTRTQIETEIRESLPQMPQDPRESHQQLKTAQELIDRLDSAPDAPYRCYMAYKRSLALAGLPHFEPGTDQLHYEQVRQRLIDDVTDAYVRAYEKLKSQQFRDATEAFRWLTRVYPDPASEIHQNARKQQRIAARQLGKRRRRR